jgi:mannose-6-phosphate isomerase-like protein (cupin superfamily)
MYNAPNMYQYPYNANTPMRNAYNMYQCPYFVNTPMYNPDLWNQFPNQYLPYINQAKASTPIILRDYGSNPFVVDIEEATKQNNNFRLALWTGNHLQLTLMSINVGEDIGVENHPNLDQFIRIEEGQGLVKMGDRKDRLDFQANVRDDFAFIIPAGKWHNLINTGNTPLKLYSIYAPPQHPFGTVHKSKADAQAAEENHSH